MQAALAPEPPLPNATFSDELLTDKQVGSIRQIENIVSQLDGEWAMMGGRSGLQEDFGAYRFQLAFSGLTLALSHYHRLPNAPGVFKPIFEKIISKMLLPDVWIYWHYVSQGGAPSNAHLYGELPAQWDPLGKENIMYSAYLLMLTRLYHYLFDDDKYTKKGALTLGLNPFTFGERMVFEYDEESLSETIYWQMVENGYLGVACEPNCVFQICNQPSILAFRIEDFLKGTSRAEEVTEGYLKAWSEFGLVDEAGHSVVHVAFDSKTPVPNALPWLWSDAWLAALMNAWNSQHVYETYPKQINKFLIPGPDGTCGVKLWEPIDWRGQPESIDTADFGWAIAAASELGDQDMLDAFLKHADTYMDPEWRNGGLYYPRNDTRYDEDGILRQVEPITSNALIPYGRLNVPHGLRTFYEKPWGKDHFAEPMISGVSENVGILMAVFTPAEAELKFALQPREDRKGDGRLEFTNVFDRQASGFVIYRDGQAVGSFSGSTLSAEAGVALEREGDTLVMGIARDQMGAFSILWR